MHVTRSIHTIHRSAPKRSAPSSFTPSTDRYTPSNAGWKVAGACVMLAAVPVGVVAQKVSVGALVGLAGLALMFGPDIAE